MKSRAVCTRLPAQKSFVFRWEAAFLPSYSEPFRRNTASERSISDTSQSIFCCSAAGRFAAARGRAKRRKARRGTALFLMSVIRLPDPENHLGEAFHGAALLPDLERDLFAALLVF